MNAGVGVCTRIANLNLGAVAANTWYFVTFTYERATGTVTAYLNEAAPHTGSNVTSTYVDTYPMIFGTAENGSADAAIDDVRLYNTALSANDVAELYGSRFTVAGIEKMSQTANVSIQATNNITLDLGGDTIDMAANRNLSLTAGNDILSASAGSIQTATDGVTANTGNILLAAGNNINLTHDADLVTTGAGNATDRGTVTLRANNVISYSGSGDITTQAGAITINSDRDGVAGGSVALNTGTVLTSNGGNVTIGGGATPASVKATGVTGNVYGVAVLGATINSGAGNIILNGTGHTNAAGSDLYGVVVGSNALLQTTSGNITLSGMGGSSTQWNNGIRMGGSSVITTATGAISLNGTGGPSSGAGYGYGIVLDAPSTISSTGVGAGAGTITLTGTGATVGVQATGIGLYGTTVSSKDGAISMTGVGGAPGGNGILFYNTNNILSTGSAPISFTGTQGGGYSDMALANYVGFTNTIGGASATGPITLNANAPSMTLNGTLDIRTTGSVNIVPRTTPTSIGIAGAGGALTITSAFLNTITAGQLNIGSSAGAAAIQVAANTWTNNTNIINGTSNITFTGAQTTGTKLLSATTTSGNITINASATITSTATGNAVTLNSGTGTFTNNAVISTANGNTSITADTIALGANLSGTGSLTLQPSTNGQAINLNNGVAGFALDTAELGRIQPGFSSVQFGSASGSGAFTVGGATWNSPTTLLTGTGGITFTGAQVTGANSFTARTTGASNITLNAGSSITSNATGNAIVLASAQNFINLAGTNALSTQFGRWLIYSTDPASNTNGQLSSAFLHYNGTYASYAPASVTETGKGFIYSVADPNPTAPTTTGPSSTTTTVTTTEPVSITPTDPVVIPPVETVVVPPTETLPPITPTTPTVIELTTELPSTFVYVSQNPVSLVENVPTDGYMPFFRNMIWSETAQQWVVSDTIGFHPAASFALSAIPSDDSTDSETAESSLPADDTNLAQEENTQRPPLSAFNGLLQIDPELAKRLKLDALSWN